MPADDNPTESDRSTAAKEAKVLTVSDEYADSFEDLVLAVQLEHEIAGFETVTTTRIDQLIHGQLGEAVSKTAMILVCHAEIAKEAIDLSPRMAGLFPCTTVVYESATDGEWYIYHVSALQATSDLGFFPDATQDLEEIVSMTEDRMGAVWAELETRFGA